MSEIGPLSDDYINVKWHEAMISLAAGDDSVRNLADWLLERQGNDSDSETYFEYMAKASCRKYDLNPDYDFDEVLELCEQWLIEEPLNG